jgi:hypothetical protein
MSIEYMSLQIPMTRLFLALMLFTQGGLQPGTGIVTGSIRTAEGRPAAGMRVAAIAIDDPDGNNLLSLAQTDASGRYTLSNIPEGSYYIVAGRVTRLTFYPSGSEAASAQKISVEPARIVSSINIVVPSIVTTSAAQTSNRAYEVVDYVRIDGESNLDRKLKLLQKFQKDFPQSDILPDLFPIIMDVYIARQNTETALAFTQKVLLAGAQNVITLIQESRAHASRSEFEKAIQVAEQAVSSAERLKGRHPPTPYDGPSFDRWAGTYEQDARKNLAVLKRLALR